MEDNVIGEQTGASAVWMMVVSLVQVLLGLEIVINYLRTQFRWLHGGSRDFGGH